MRHISTKVSTGSSAMQSCGPSRRNACRSRRDGRAAPCRRRRERPFNTPLERLDAVMQAGGRHVHRNIFVLRQFRLAPFAVLVGDADVVIRLVIVKRQRRPIHVFIILKSLRGFYPTTAPLFTGAAGSSSTSLPAASSPMRIIPRDSIPLSVRGSRLTSTNTCRPTSSSGV